MYYEDFNIISGKADSMLFFNAEYQNTVNYAISELLSRSPMDWTPDTIWIDADANTLHMWSKNDRANTEKAIVME